MNYLFVMYVYLRTERESYSLHRSRSSIVRLVKLLDNLIDEFILKFSNKLSELLKFSTVN